MALIVALIFVAICTFAIYKLIMWSRRTGNNIGNVGALVIALIMMVGVKTLVPLDSATGAKATTSTTSKSAVTVKTTAPAKQTISTADANLKSRIENYVQSLPGSMVVRIGGNSEYGFSVDVDYNFMTSDKAAAKAAAVDLIYDIVGANSDCGFKWIYVNCMDGKSPIGLIVQYENGEFRTLP